MDNPKATIDALLEAPKKVAKFTVYPLTVVRYAVLELLQSPFIDPRQKLTLLTAIPSIYVMTTSAEKLSKWGISDAEKLKEEAFKWADEHLDTAAMVELAEAITEKLKAIRKLAPEDLDEDGKKKD